MYDKFPTAFVDVVSDTLVLRNVKALLSQLSLVVVVDFRLDNDSKSCIRSDQC